MSTNDFSKLIQHEDLINALTGLGITTPTKVQEAAIPVLLQKKDAIAQAKTGSGKTLAFVLPMLSALRAAPPQRSTYCLIMTPTRELAQQVSKVIASVAPDVIPACIIGGERAREQIADIRADGRVVVGTPGRLLDLIERREIVLRKCQMFVLDEADEMLSMGFVEEVEEILSKIPKPRHGLFFSATITPRVQMLAKKFLTSPTTITIGTEDEQPPDIKHQFCRVGPGLTSKTEVLCKLLTTEQPRSAIIFCNTKSDTELVEVVLRRRGIDARRINSDLSQKERDAIMASVRSGELKLLIATDIAARGIDIEHIDLVVNYSIHEQVEVYVHRTGRTGRAGRSGKAISLVGPQDFAQFRNLTNSLTVELGELSVV